MPADFQPDLDAYFSRIGYTGPREATLGVLAEIARRHVYAIPFENLDILLGRGISLELAAIEQKFVRQRRGGYCFEHNGYFAQVLRALGFAVTPLAARVRWQVAPEMTTPLTHMLLLVGAGSRRFIVDVGFGSLSLTAPLDFDADGEQATPHEARRVIRRADGVHIQQARLAGAWSDVYVFTLQEQQPVDYEIANWWTCTHPLSRFVTNLVVARAGEGVRYALFNAELTVRPVDGPAEKRTIQTPDELLEVLVRHFDLHFPRGTRFGLPGAAWPR